MKQHQPLSGTSDSPFRLRTHERAQPRERSSFPPHRHNRASTTAGVGCSRCQMPDRMVRWEHRLDRRWSRHLGPSAQSSDRHQAGRTGASGASAEAWSLSAWLLPLARLPIKEQHGVDLLRHAQPGDVRSRRSALLPDRHRNVGEPITLLSRVLGWSGGPDGLVSSAVLWS